MIRLFLLSERQMAQISPHFILFSILPQCASG